MFHSCLEQKIMHIVTATKRKTSLAVLIDRTLGGRKERKMFGCFWMALLSLD